MKRKCAVCGKKLEIKVYKNRKYEGGYYFGKIDIPVGKGEWRKIGKSQLLGKLVDVVEWNGKEKKVEYWECERCFREE